MFMTQEAVNEKPSNNIRNISDIMLKENSDLICKDCSASYQSKLRQKFKMLEVRFFGGLSPAHLS